LIFSFSRCCCGRRLPSFRLPIGLRAFSSPVLVDGKKMRLVPCFCVIVPRSKIVFCRFLSSSPSCIRGAEVGSPIFYNFFRRPSVWRRGSSSFFFFSGSWSKCLRFCFPTCAVESSLLQDCAGFRMWFFSSHTFSRDNDC